MTAKIIGQRLLILLAVLALLAGVGFWTFRNVGRWLVVQDTLQPARAIVVLSGRLPFRSMEAAQIYRQGLAPEVWLFMEEPSAAYEALLKLGVHQTAEHEYDEQVLERLGVPKTAIRVLEPPATNTRSEFELLRDELHRQGGDRIILVTSPVHTRRSRKIWRLVVGDHPQAILRYAPSEPSDPDHWWRTTQDVEAVVHEIMGLINAYLGFVAEPRK